MDDPSTNQDQKINNNPTGIGGFGDHPEHRSDGRWSKETSFSYWLNYFKSLSTEAFMAWNEKTPQNERLVAADLAYARVVKARDELREFQEVADRTEGRPQQTVDMTSGGQPMPILGSLNVYPNNSTEQNNTATQADQDNSGGDERRQDDRHSDLLDPLQPDQSQHLG